MTSAALPNGESPQQAEFIRLRDSLPPAPAGLREKALAEFSRLGFPTVRQEDWRYTNLRDIAGGDFSAGAAEGPLDAATAQRLRDEIGDAPGLIFADGRLLVGLDTDALAAGVELRPLADGLPAGASVRTALVALNTALCRSGAVLTVADDIAVDTPIHILHAATPGHPTRANHVRTFVTVGRNSRVTLIEHFLGLGDAGGWTNAATDITLAEGAQLAHGLIQQQSQGAYHTADVFAVQAAGSRFHSLSIALGAKLCRNDIRTRLAGTGASCSFDGLYLAAGDQHVDHHTLIEHAAAHCTSEELYKGILGGRAVAVFNGAVIVHNEAQRTDARQLNKNLLLSGDATINTKPQLEIFADDVKCGHGATIGRLDDEAIFFLRARGIDEAAARILLTYAFANEVVERLADERLRERLETAVRDHLDAIVAARRNS